MNPGLPSIWRRYSVLTRFEYFFVCLIIVSIGSIANFVIKFGYLPEPFFSDVTDTFMDWYNTAYWAQHGGAFEYWSSVYPPLAILFAKLFSLHECYAETAAIGRSCDRTGVVLLSALMVVNFVLSYRALRLADAETALPRAIALGFGAPMLLAWERGNQIIPCYTLFILAYSQILRSGWLKMICAAATINFKPYLIVVVFAQLARRKWRWLEGMGIALLLIYTATYCLLGEGSPSEVLQDILGFGQPTGLPSVYSLRFAVTYRELLRIVDSPYPLMLVTGSAPLEAADRWLPPLMSGGLILTVASLIGALFLPKALSANRLSALAVCLFFAVDSPGGYALDFLLFFIFTEKWTGLLGALIVLCAYIWCVPGDVPAFHLVHQSAESYISARTVFTDANLTYGQLLHPAVFLVLEYALAAMSLRDLLYHSRGALRAMAPPTPEPRAAGA